LFVESTESVQDYLKAIYLLAQAGEEVTTTAVADRLGVSAASVTSMIKRLAFRGLLRHQRYQGVELTGTGRKLALEVIRHHRLLEAYLHRELGMTWDQVHDEAEILEHAISEDFEERIAEILGHPTHDPHGDPIPPKNGKYVEVRHAPLMRFSSGPALVERVSDRDPEALRYLDKLGIRPGSLITVEQREPFGGPLWVRVGRRRHAIGPELAEAIYVSKR
jgi:DtxR family transcriptional regulator, Mn-dependent transcriptional regulator